MDGFVRHVRHRVPIHLRLDRKVTYAGTDSYQPHLDLRRVCDCSAMHLCAVAAYRIVCDPSGLYGPGFGRFAVGAVPLAEHGM